MRIVHSLAPARYGGLERVVQTLSQAQARAGHEVHVVVVLDAGGEAEHPFPALARRDGVHVHVVPIPLRAYRRERRLVGDLYRKLAPDVVHTHGYRADVLHSAVARRLGIPTVTTVHGFTAGGLKNRVYEMLQRLSYRRCQAVVAVSRPMADRLASGGVRERLHCVPNAWGGLGAEAVEPREARSRLHVPDGVFHVGFVGRVDKVKGADVFVEAIGRLRDDLAFEASMIGTGPAQRSLETRAAELGVADRILWHGHVPEAGRWFSAFDVYVLSSRTEGTPIALLEAMGAGVPIVATRVGGVVDVVSEREALLVGPERPDQLAAAIRHVHDDPEGARHRADAARKRLNEDFSLDVWIRRYDGIYETAVAQCTGQASGDAV